MDQSVTNIFKYSNIRIFSIQISIRTFVHINFLIRIYSDIRSCQFFDTNIFGHSFISKNYSNIFVKASTLSQNQYLVTSKHLLRLHFKTPTWQTHICALTIRKTKMWKMALLLDNKNPGYPGIRYWFSADKWQTGQNVSTLWSNCLWRVTLVVREL